MMRVNASDDYYHAGNRGGTNISENKSELFCNIIVKFLKFNIFDHNFFNAAIICITRYS